ncbi:MAG: hypothetical protein ACKVPY_04510 [Paracoccaceae bacterium]
MFTPRIAFLALALSAFAAWPPAHAATLTAVNITDPKHFIQDDGIGAPEQPRLFSTHTARAQNVNNNGRTGDDLFLRSGTGANLATGRLLWGASGTVYNWSLSFNGTQATYSLGGVSINSAVAAANWNVVGFRLRANDLTRFTTSTVTVNVTSANGLALSVPLRFSTTNSTFTSLTYALNGLQTITNLSGTMKFDYTVRAGAKQGPGDALSFGIDATQVTDVPLPAGALLLLGALAAMAMICRAVPPVRAE